MKQIIALNNSKWCIKYLIQYLTGKNLTSIYKNNKNFTQKQLYSLCLQICKINYILFLGGFSHNDLWSDNIIITPTTKKFFNLFNNNIPYYGYQITIIDYGEVKFINKENKKNLFTETVDFIFPYLLHNYQYLAHNSSKKEKELIFGPNSTDYYGKGFKCIIHNNYDFYENFKDEYFKIFPKSKKYITNIITKIKDEKSTDKYFYDYDELKYGTPNNVKNFYSFIFKLYYEFALRYPRLYSKYFNWSSTYKGKIPDKIMHNLLFVNNFMDLTNTLIDLIKH